MPEMAVQKNPASDNGEQPVLDDYIEFLDRRYNRLHRNEEEDALGVNTVCGWFMSLSPPSYVSPSRKQEDSLCILGLTEVASNDLLRKHKLDATDKGTSMGSSMPSIAISTLSFAIDSPGSITPKMKSPSSAGDACIAMGKVNSSAGARILQRIKAKRDAICAVQMHKFLAHSFIQSARKTLFLMKKATLAAVAMGGGKQNLKYTAAAVMSLFILLRPIFSATLQG
mmetsp:Transcript_21894/g.32242  ORF Transcript_21894/g.32242 Transcript_21894/m.32242 type:complete len:226 (+) Transcript_21894:3-680(+)